jgi:hypothetical protein
MNSPRPARRAPAAAVSSVRARSWAELSEILYEDSWVESLGLFRSRYVFRGEASPDLELRTSLQRLGATAAETEPHLLRNFRKFARPDDALGDSIWNWLALGQHHGLPTRLLDWTFSPYVALHFATAASDRGDSDGVVWCVDFRQAHARLPPRLRRSLARERADLFTTNMLAEAAPRLEDLGRLGRAPFAIFFDPPSLDQRLTNQFSVFSLLSDPKAEMRTFLSRGNRIARKVIIPANLKGEIRDKLDQANITERVLFPGLDGLARWLARYYAPRIDSRLSRGRGTVLAEGPSPEASHERANRKSSVRGVRDRARRNSGLHQRPRVRQER